MTFVFRQGWKQREHIIISQCVSVSQSEPSALTLSQTPQAASNRQNTPPKLKEKHRDTFVIGLFPKRIKGQGKLREMQNINLNLLSIKPKTNSKRR